MGEEGGQMKQADIDKLYEKYKRKEAFNNAVPEREFYQALEEYEQIQWHDLRENPDDLPEESRYSAMKSELVYVKYKDGGYGIEYYDYMDNLWSCSYERNRIVIAWRELPQWKEK